MLSELRTAPRASTISERATGAGFFLEPGVSVTSPQAGALVRGTGLIVNGQAFCVRVQLTSTGDETRTDAIDAIDKVEVHLGVAPDDEDTGTFKLATPTGPLKPGTTQKRWSTWSCQFSEISGVSNDALQITAKVTAGGFTDKAVITVQVDRTPPVLQLATPQQMAAPMVGGSATFVVRGTATDALSAVTVVERALDQAQFAPTTPKAANDWSEWSASVAVTTVGPHKLAVRAKDQEGNVTPLLVVDLEARPNTLADVSSTRAHLDDLLEFAENRATRPVGAALAPLDRPTLTAAFHQPFDALAAQDDAKQAVAGRPVRPVRICVEVLRKYVASRGRSVPAAAEARYRQAAYEGLLRRLGTSSEEIRLARAADPAARAALAARLGIDLAPKRPDELDQLGLPPEQLTEQNLERLFGLADSKRDPFGPAAPPALLLTWQLAHLRAVWQQQDGARRTEFGGPLPIVDPDLIGTADLVAPRPGDQAFDFWDARRQELAQKLSQIRAARTAQSAPLAAFDAAVNQFVGSVGELVTLAERYRAGGSVESELGARQLPLTAFIRLMRIRDLATAGTVLDAEWADVEAILLQVQKLRTLYKTWRDQEAAKGLTLAPSQFAPAGPAAGRPVELPAWRATPRARRAWQEILRARASQERAVGQALEAAVDAIEVATLPGLRDALIAASDPTIPADLTTPQARDLLRAAADRLSQELLIDLRSGGDTPTTRLDQAIETLQGALFAVRIDRFTAPHPAAAWALTASGGYTEAKYDEEWRWMGAYATWRAATAAFYYPQNSLLPGTRPVRPDDPATTAREQDPTAAFQALLQRLRGGAPLTPVRARQEAATYLAAVRTELGSSLPAGLQNPPADKKPLLLNDQLTEAQLVQLGTWAKTLFPATVTNPHQAPAALKEVFYFVPMALALELQKAGQYLAALDWLQTVYAYNLSGDARKVYHGLRLDANIQTSYQRGPDWLLDGLNPHTIAATRANALTQFTILSIVRCFLAFADAEFTRDTRESLPRARALYETALGLLSVTEMEPPAAASSTPVGQLPRNPVLEALHRHAELSLAKLRSGRNIAGLARPPEGGTVPDGALVIRRPTPYRYPALFERANRLVANAQQIEGAFLAALEKRDAEAYNHLRAQQDLAISGARVALQTLRVTEAEGEVTLAGLQQERAQIQVDHFREQLDQPVSFWETLSVSAAIVGGVVQVATAAAANPAAGFTAAMSTLSSVSSTVASFERRAQEWQLQLALAQQDVDIGAQEVLLAEGRKAVVVQEEAIAKAEETHARDTEQFLANKFTDVELYEFMSGVLERVYRFFLQQATAVARLAEQQLAFERQERPPAIIQADYWEVSADEGAATAPGGQAADRRGLTGSARLLRDLTQLDQYAFESDRRKLQLTKTISLAELAPVELQRFRETGVIIFATPLELFDREFPGHYLRLLERVRTSVIALIPPSQGIRATLSTVGTSRVVAGDAFETVVVNHGPESVALSAPRDASGLFELNVQPEMRPPFQGFGVDTVWRLEMPRAANPFDFRTIADVLLTLEYTALDSPVYRQQVIQTLDPRVSAERPFSFREQFADQWYDLHNPDQTATPLSVRFRTRREDFQPNVEDPRIEHVVLYLARTDSRPLPDPLPLDLRLEAAATDGNQAPVGGTATSSDGLYSTRRTAAAWREGFTGVPPVGEWELALPNTPAVRDLFQQEAVEDIVFVITMSGRTPDWPA